MLTMREQETSTAADGEPLTTAGPIAIGNLQAQIDGYAREAAVGRLAVHGQAVLIELITLRGHLLGCIADYESAAGLAEQLVQDAPLEGEAVLARARSRALLHRFAESLADLDLARRLGSDRALVDAERATIFQATGLYDLALRIYREALERRPDFKSVGDLATLHAERGDTAAADIYFSESRAHYRGVSPIPLAQLDLKQAQMWMAAGDLSRARSLLGAAVRRLPAYAPAVGHLAEVEAAMGRTGSAVTRLRTLTGSSDDPVYPAQLSRILAKVGHLEEAAQWRSRAAVRYDELVTRHLAAFADHAAEFWLEAGTAPARALWFAQRNFEVRPTRRAHELVALATLANAMAPSVGTTTTRR